MIEMNTMKKPMTYSRRNFLMILGASASLAVLPRISSAEIDLQKKDISPISQSNIRSLDFLSADFITMKRISKNTKHLNIQSTFNFI